MTNRLRVSLVLACALVIVGTLVPGAAGARTITKQTELGELTVKGNDFSLKLDADSSAIDPGFEAHAAGSRLGRIPTGCAGKMRARRIIICALNKIFAADFVLFAFLVGVVTGDGSLACPVLIEAERIRLGGAACPERIAAEAPELARREPELVYIAGTGFGRRATAEAVVLLDRPRDAMLFQLAVTPRRYWRITDVSDLFP